MAVVLIVDDDAALRADICDTLADLGHTPVAAETGLAALAVLDHQPIAAVVRD